MLKTPDAETALLTRCLSDLVLLRGPLNHLAGNGFLVHRVADEATRSVTQLATLVWFPPAAPACRQYPEGYPVAPEVLAALPTLGDGPGIVVVRPAENPWIGELVTALVRASGRELNHRTLAEKAAEFDADQVYVIAIEDGRACGFAAAYQHTSNLILSTTNATGFIPEGCMFVPPLVGMTIPCTELVWVADRWRGVGLADALVRTMAEAFEMPVAKMAYGLPFSRAGFRLVRRVVGDQFIAAAQQIGAVMLPLSQESRLAPCHHRIAVSAEQSEQVLGEMSRCGIDPGSVIDAAQVRPQAIQLPRSAVRSSAKKRPKRMFRAHRHAV